MVIIDVTKNPRLQHEFPHNALCEVRNMINPFQYGGVVGKDAFFNRKQELADLINAIENGERLFVYSERRVNGA